MNVKRLRFLCVEIYKTINNLNLSFRKQIFELQKTNRSIREKYRLNLNILNYNQVTFGKKSLRIFGPKIWNSLPYLITWAKGRISKRVFQESKARQNFRKTIISYLLIQTRGSRAIVLLCLRGSEIFSRGYFVGAKFFLVGI